MTTAIQKKFYIKHFESEINAIAQCVTIFKRSGHRADEAFLEIGNLLVQTQQARDLDEEVFTRLKAHIAKLIGRHGLRDVNRIVAIAQCELLQRYKDELPTDWNFLYLLTKKENLAEFLAQGIIKSDTPVEVAMKQLKSENVTRIPSKKWFLKNNDVMYTGEDVEKLRKLLSTSCWMIQNRHAKQTPHASA